MRYFITKRSSDPKEVGCFPQTGEVIKPGNLSNLKFEGSIYNEIELPIITLADGATPTTMLSCVRVPHHRLLTVTSDFVEFIREFNIPNHQTWELEIHSNIKIMDYLLFYICDIMDEDVIDFELSSFEVGQHGDWKDPSVREPVDLPNYNAYKNLRLIFEEQFDGSYLRSKELVLDFTEVKTDMVRIGNVPGLGNGYYISERLRAALEEAGLSTGIHFKEIQEVDKTARVIY